MRKIIEIASPKRAEARRAYPLLQRSTAERYILFREA
jgi:hypothetical protein